MANLQEFFHKRDEERKNRRIDPLEYIFKFGKYSNKSFEEVWKTDPIYIHWCINNVADFSTFPSTFIRPMNPHGRTIPSFSKYADQFFISNRLRQPFGTPLVYPGEDPFKNGKTLSQLMEEHNKKIEESIPQAGFSTHETTAEGFKRIVGNDLQWTSTDEFGNVFSEKQEYNFDWIQF